MVGPCCVVVEGIWYVTGMFVCFFDFSVSVLNGQLAAIAEEGNFSEDSFSLGSGNHIDKRANE